MDSVESTGNFLRTLTCFNFYRGWRGISEYYRHYLPEGISAQQSYILELCDADCGVDVGTLAKMLEIDSPAISSMLRRMEASDLVRREVVPTDRRRTLVFLTPTGTEMRDEIRVHASLADKELLKHISPAESAQLACIVEKIFNAIGTREGTKPPQVKADRPTPAHTLPLITQSKAEHKLTLNLPV